MSEKPIYEELTQKIEVLEQENKRLKHAEEAWGKSEAKMRSIFRVAPVGIGLVSDRVLLEVNEQLCEMTGYSPDELIGKNARILYPTDKEYEYVGMEKYRQIEEQGTGTVETCFKCKNGEIINVLLSSTPLDLSDLSAGVTFTALDFTYRKLAEEALIEAGSRLHMALNASNVGLWDWNLLTNEVYFSPEWKRQIGYEDNELSGRYEEWEVRLHPEDRDQVLEVLNEYLNKQRQVFKVEFRLRHKDGSYRWIYAEGEKIEEKEGKIIRMVGCHIDFTEKKQAEELLRESEEKYRQLFDMESDAIFMIEKDSGNIIEVNEAATRIYGYTRDEFLKMKNTDVSAEPDKTSQATQERIESIPIRYHQKKDGTVFPVEITATHLNFKGREVHIAAIRDISFRIEADEAKARLEAQLQQAQKMEAIGTLAGGIAHDFNNILSPIMIHSEMVMEDLPSDSPLQQNLKEIYRASDRARELVRQILTFSRQHEEERIALNASRIIKEAVKLLRSTLPTTIDIQLDIQTQQDRILAEPSQVHQIIMNLCTNAAHAMEEKGGVLEVVLTDQDLDSESVKMFSDLEPGRYLRLSVRDTGRGIEPQYLDKIFEPYFTTKETGKGTGMGLALVHGIVKSYEGTVTVYSEIGQGTTFHIYLPLIEGETSYPEKTRYGAEIPRGTEHILFVDDEKVAVDTMREMLERLGYRVTGRTSSIEALEVFRNRPAEFDLVITDQTMPNMTGKDLARELLAIRPDTPIILCTGFSEQIDERKAKELGIRAFVMKPIIMSEIAQIIRMTLE